jgi:hypothetical protein
MQGIFLLAPSSFPAPYLSVLSKQSAGRMFFYKTWDNHYTQLSVLLLLSGSQSLTLRDSSLSGKQWRNWNPENFLHSSIRSTRLPFTAKTSLQIP